MLPVNFAEFGARVTFLFNQQIYKNKTDIYNLVNLGVPVVFLFDGGKRTGVPRQDLIKWIVALKLTIWRRIKDDTIRLGHSFINYCVYCIYLVAPFC
jgi:hypothetical protein